MSKFRYQAPSIETIKARSVPTGDFDSYVDSRFSFVKVKEGENTFRIMPPSWDFKDPKALKRWGDTWGIIVWLHWSVGPEKSTYLCPRKMLGDPCPICDMCEELPEKEAKDLSAKKSTIAWIINRDDEKAGPQLWRLGPQSEADIQSRSWNKKTGEVLNISHPDHGFDLSFQRTGTTKEKTRYFGWDVARDESPLCDSESKQEAWLDFLMEHPLPDILVIHDAEYLEKVIMGKGAKQSSEEDDEKPTRSRRAAKNEDAEEEERPRRRADADEEEETPRRRTREPRYVPAESRPAEEETPRRRTREPEADAEEERPRRRSREPEPEDEPEEKPTRGRHQDPEEEEVEERPRRRAQAEDEPEPNKGSTASRAKASLERLKPKDKDEKPSRKRPPADEEEDEIPF